MTIEEAYELITNIVQGDGTNMTKEKDEALYYAQKAMEKQIPKKIIERTEADREYIDYCCPACKVILEQKLKSVKFPLANRDSTVKTFKYCYGCGQKIDWSNLK